MYIQLEKIINSCIEDWFECELLFWAKIIYCGKYWLESEYWSTFYMSYNDLFSKDTWFIDFISKEYENKYIDDYWIEKISYKTNKRHYFKMSLLKSEEKIKYFLKHIHRN